MNITVEKQPKCLATVTIEVSADQVTTERANIVKGYTAQARIPGFRPGKAPLHVIEKRFGKDIDEELQKRLIDQGINEAARKDELSILNVLQPTDIAFADSGSFSFKSEFVLAPEFETPDYSNITLSVPSTEVTDEDFNQALTNLQERYSDFNDVDKAAEIGDVVTIDYTTTCEGKPVEEVAGKPVGFLAKNEGYWIKMDAESFLPGFCPELVGLKAGDEKTVEVTIPEDFPISSLRGKSVAVAAKLISVKQQSLPELNDELAGKIVPGKDLDGLKELLRESLQEQKEREIEDVKVQQLVDHLSNGLEFELPERLVEFETRNTLNQRLQQALQSGAKPEQLETLVATLREEATEQATKNLRTNFILQRIAAAEGIQVEDNELIGQIQQMANQQKTPIKKFIKKLQESNQIAGVRNSILIGKTIDHLVSKAEVINEA